MLRVDNHLLQYYQLDQTDASADNTVVAILSV